MIRNGLFPAVLAFAFGIAYAAQAAEPRVGDVWLVSTRSAARYGNASLESQPIRYWRLDEKHCWQASNLSEFAAADESEPQPLPVVVFLHGNREGLAQSIRSSELVRQPLLAAADGRRFRLVIWSWPSDQIGRKPRPDVQIKAAYTPQQSHYLAEFLTRVDTRSRVCLLGYSYGSRIAAGSLHLLGGGRLAGRGMTTAAERLPTIAAVLTAPAFEAGAFSPRGRYSMALQRASRIVVTCNRYDSVLRFYPRLYGRGGPPAMGFVGPYGVADGRLRVGDVSRWVGKSHDWRRYAAAHWVRRALLDDVFAP